jgi:microcystin-dependent protein
MTAALQMGANKITGMADPTVATDGATKGYVDNITIPIGGGMDYWGATVPSSNFAFPIGQAISRTTYAALFAIIGTTYGIGDGSTTFNLPDKTGRVSAMKEATATRLTTAAGGVDGGTMGAAAGLQTRTLAANQIPAGVPSSNPSQSITVNSNRSDILIGGASDNFGSIAGSGEFDNLVKIQVTSTGSNSISVTSTNASQQALITVQPTIVCNYIIRII